MKPERLAIARRLLVRCYSCRTAITITGSPIFRLTRFIYNTQISSHHTLLDLEVAINIPGSGSVIVESTLATLIEVLPCLFQNRFIAKDLPIEHITFFQRTGTY